MRIALLCCVLAGCNASTVRKSPDPDQEPRREAKQPAIAKARIEAEEDPPPKPRIADFTISLGGVDFIFDATKENEAAAMHKYRGKNIQFPLFAIESVTESDGYITVKGCCGGPVVVRFSATNKANSPLLEFSRDQLNGTIVEATLDRGYPDAIWGAFIYYRNAVIVKPSPKVAETLRQKAAQN